MSLGSLQTSQGTDRSLSLSETLNEALHGLHLNVVFLQTCCGAGVHATLQTSANSTWCAKDLHSGISRFWSAGRCAINVSGFMLIMALIKLNALILSWKLVGRCDWPRFRNEIFRKIICDSAGFGCHCSETMAHWTFRNSDFLFKTFEPTICNACNGNT